MEIVDTMLIRRYMRSNNMSENMYVICLINV